MDGSRAVFLLVACCTQDEDAAGAATSQAIRHCKFLISRHQGVSSTDRRLDTHLCTNTG